MIEAILVLNAGSSSLKFALYDLELAPLCRGDIEEIGRANMELSGPLADQLKSFGSPPKHADRDTINAWLVANLRKLPDLVLRAAGHRIVHGGRRFRGPVRIDADVLAELRSLIPLAPDHQPHNLAMVAAVAAQWPDLPQVACFDTAFHRTQPRLAEIFPLPRALTDAGVLRYGFHGLSYQYIASVLPDYLGTAANGRVIIAHLGNGASLCALKNRESVATTMGFTTLDGLMMGTRSGSIDPGVVLHLILQEKMTADEVSKLLNKQSGLLGVSGISSDVRSLQASPDPHAAEALELFAYRVIRETGSLMAALGGLDAFVFTAGIGENAANMRKMICDGLEWTGLSLDSRRNTASEKRISTEASKINVLVIPTNEEMAIATNTRQLICRKAA
ncbi:MAG: acetate/propionate family kinase [Methylovirgula sp.]